MTAGASRPLLGSRAFVLAAVGIVVLGAFLRAYRFASSPRWIDEYGTWWAVDGGLYGDVWQRVVAVHGQSPLYYLIVRLFTDVFGVSTTTLRLPSLLFGILLVPFGMRLAWRVFEDRPATLLTGLALAVSGGLISVSQDARPYALGLLFAVLAVDAYVRVIRGNSGEIAFVVWMTLAWYADYIYALTLVIVLAHLLVTRPKAAWRKPLLLAGIAGVLMAPGLIQLDALYRRRESMDWAARSRNVVTEVIDIGTDLINAKAFLPAAILAVFLLVRSLGGRVSAVMPELRRRTTDAHGNALTALWFSVPLVAGALFTIASSTNVLVPRYSSLAIPAACVVIGLVLAMPRTGSLLDIAPAILFVAGTVLVSFVPAMDESGAFAVRHDEQWDTAVESVARGYEPDDLVLYRTSFPEADLVVGGLASEKTAGFVAFPVRANLPDRGREMALRSLPYRDPVDEEALVEELLDPSAFIRRIWLVELEPDAADAVDAATLAEVAADRRVVVVRDERFGDVRVLLLTRAA